MPKKNDRTKPLPFLDDKIEKNMSNLISIALGIVTMIAGYAIFNLFNTKDIGTVVTNDDNTVNKDINDSLKTLENIKSEENIEDKAVANNKEDTTKEETGIIQDTKEQTNNTWVANNYKEGDITESSHTVVSGDTLWEIAEATYGDGTQWNKIADANNVDYLPNGNPLIIPGQTLTIPN